MNPVLLLAPLFFLTALVYASVGFGGGSTYLALLVLFDLPYTIIPQLALVCNLIVVSGGLYHYVRAGLVDFKRALPFVITSIPMAYLGGLIPVSKSVFLTLLGISLGLAGLRLLRGEVQGEGDKQTKKYAWPLSLVIGAGLGLISGLVGLGGGIFLAPLLYFMRWGNARQIAAMASFFIFANSLFGLGGQITKTGLELSSQEILPSLALAVFIGGQVGSRISIKNISLKNLQRGTAVLILFVSARIFWNLFSS